MPPIPPMDPARRARLLRSVTYASVIVAICLVVAKAWAWQATGSVSMLSSLADSLLDCLASGLTFWAVRYSMSPADAEHRFGHGKSEGLAALIQGLIIGGSGLFVCGEAVGRMLMPRQIEETSSGLLVIGGATAATFVLVAYQRFVSRRTGSVAIGADAMHYSADLLANVGVGAALYVSSRSGWLLLDPLVGLAIGGYVLLSSAKMIAQSLDILLDREIPDADRYRLQQIALTHPDVLGLHDMRTRHGGAHYIVQFHLDLPHHISLWRSHEILDEVEESIRREYPGCEIIIHPDPLGIAETKDSFELPAEDAESGRAPS
ncbi:Ferrous-iron efflux pump FieF [Gammaproteobacteria bacterium]|nr:cation diffusion facilitator family transporter [Gammaproteobacteria bacterium]QOJ31724.1 MAG: cation diffusion facilitator family transporter [Gammaproteobacteria bacterium]CAG0942032.1 Ferrous-iron efflux pump FieF [Gammaproteobacteria bacterium]